MNKIKIGSFATIIGKRYKSLSGKLVLIKSLSDDRALTETIDSQINSIPINHLKQIRTK